MLPLLILVVGLAVAAVWFVALPSFDDKHTERSCEVVVLETGSSACVRDPTRGSRALRRKSDHSGRAKR